MTPLFRIMPTVFLSWTTYLLSVIRFPRFIPFLFILIFRKLYRIDMSEVDGDLKSFRSLAGFFVRRLVPQARPVDESADSVVSPVDGMIVDTGRISESTVFSVKGSPYTVKELIGDESRSSAFTNGVFTVIHLRPFDYHRIHVPLSGKVEGHCYISGRLLPVHAKGRKAFPRVFVHNRRRITLIQSEKGIYALIKVGAFNVGRIPVEYPVPAKSGFSEVEGKPCFEKGQEIARFELGSTVVLLFQEGITELKECIPGTEVRCRSRIGTLIPDF